MNIEEAKEWLRGERSSWNTHCANVYTNGEMDHSLSMVRTAQEDAAMMEQAYWFLRAESEALVEGSCGAETQADLSAPAERSEGGPGTALREQVWQCREELDWPECVDEDDRDDRQRVHGSHKSCGYATVVGG